MTQEDDTKEESNENMTPADESVTKDKLHGKIEVTEFIDNDILNVIFQALWRLQITESHQWYHIFLSTEVVT